MPFSFGPITEDSAAVVLAAVHADFAGWARTLAASEVRHAFKSHGDAAREARRGQKPLRKSDFALIPAIVEAADLIQLKGEPKSNKPRRLVYTATLGVDRLEYVETIHPARKILAFKTMRKW